MAQPAPAPARKPRIPRHVEVTSVERSSPMWVTMRLRGEQMEGFKVEAPTAHVKLFLPAAGQTDVPPMTTGPDGRLAWSPDAVPPAIRTYTPRRYDAATHTLEVQFLLHGDGPASSWAARAEAGHGLVVVGPGGRFVMDETATRWWIAGDESALPAIGTLLEALPEGAEADVHVEIAGAAAKLELPVRTGTRVQWHVRRSAAGFGAELLDAARGAELTPETRCWVACEAGALREIRRHLLEERAMPRSSITTRGYWRIGQTDYPDHDYGED
jgi:NADPH-dependent ferric siderophore reductase